MNKPPQEAIDLFRKRTSLHIQRVRDNIYLWQDKHTEFFEELSTRALDHDKGKFFEPELTPYIWLTWENHCLINNISLKLDETIKYSIAHAISHHITKNRHHPEFYSNPDNMTKVDLIEMVCDWKAISQEMGEKSPIDYANRVLGKKFHFSPEKCEEIKKIIIELDEMCEEEERIKQRLKEITPSNEELLKMVENQKINLLRFKGYKSATELCVENPNLAEYIEQLEKETDKLRKNHPENKIDFLKIAVEKLVTLHKLFLQNKIDSILADKIRDELDELAKQIPEEQEWMRKLSASLYDLIETNTKNKNWLELLGDMQHNESVYGNDIVREVGLHKFKILWSFENNSQAKEAFKQWGEQYDDYYNNPEKYKG